MAQFGQGKASETLQDGLVLSGTIRRVDKIQIKNGKNAGTHFSRLSVTSESGRFEVYEVLDFDNSDYPLNTFVQLPVSAQARMNQGIASLSLVVRRRS